MGAWRPHSTNQPPLSLSSKTDWRSPLTLVKIRTAQLLPIIATPYRFANKRQFWACCGPGILTRSSSDRVRTQSGERVMLPLSDTQSGTATSPLG